jgi:hypothetical protein
VSAFFGVVIKMYWNERDHPIPHFHAEYGDHAAAISIDGEILGGTFPPRPLRLVGEWAACTAASWSQTGTGPGTISRSKRSSHSPKIQSWPRFHR